MDKLISLTKNHLASLRRKVTDLMIVPFLFVLVISWKAPMTSGKHTHTKNISVGTSICTIIEKALKY